MMALLSSLLPLLFDFIKEEAEKIILLVIVVGI
jgi:hypothetical protein